MRLFYTPARILDEGNYSTDVSNMTVNKLGLDNIVNSSRELGVPADWLLPIQTVAGQLIAEATAMTASSASSRR